MSVNESIIYQDAARPVAERVADLLGRMTLEEKLAQITSVWVYELFEGNEFSEDKARTLIRHGIGQITRIGGASNSSPQRSAELANAIQRFVLEQTRLGIPVMVHEESCSGYMAMGATCFPQIIGAASTWEPDLIQRMGDVIRMQMRAVGAHQSLAPVLDIVRDPRWGRAEEAFGEDPYLTSRMGTAYVQGLQGANFKEGIMATGKHFLGYGVTEGGMNWAPGHVGWRELREVFLTPFEVAIKEGKLASIMNSYHELDGIPCATSSAIFRDLLRETLGFEGLVVSDYFAIAMIAAYHHAARDKQEAASMAMNAGINVELPSRDCYGDPLKRAVENGSVAQTLVDEAVSRVLWWKFELGLFENPYVSTETAATVFDTGAQRELAHDIARHACVLLKNANNLLPIAKGSGSIAVIGPNADSLRNLMGDYSYPAHIEALVDTTTLNVFATAVPDEIALVEHAVDMVSVLQGIRSKVAAGTQVRYTKGCDVISQDTSGFDEAARIARQSDVAILVMGDKAGLTPDCTSGESRDRAKLGLPGVQEALVKAVVETGTPVILVLITGRPLTLTWMADEIPAILQAWLPGEEGGNAVADVLFGDFNPGGKLPMSFPRDAGQIPIFYNHRPSGGRSHWQEHYVETPVTPQYPFGYGLSYTQFELADLRISPDQVRAGDEVMIQVDVINTGSRAGDEVVQVYTHSLATGLTRPVKELKGFKRITLQPGEKKTVTFTLAVNQLGFYDRDKRFVVEPGAVDVMVGNSSANLPCSGTFEITGEVTDIQASKVYFSRAE
jgi:beta-glucosidase